MIEHSFCTYYIMIHYTTQGDFFYTWLSNRPWNIPFTHRRNKPWLICVHDRVLAPVVLGHDLAQLDHVTLIVGRIQPWTFGNTNSLDVLKPMLLNWMLVLRSSASNQQFAWKQYFFAFRWVVSRNSKRRGTEIYQNEPKMLSIHFFLFLTKHIDVRVGWTYIHDAQMW